MSRIADELRRARAASGVSQVKAHELTGIRQEHLSRIERGLRNPPLSDVDRLADIYGYQFVAVPKTAAAPEEILNLPPELRDIVMRLARVLPDLPPDLVEDMRHRVDFWAERYLEDSSPTSHDTRAMSS